MSYVYYRFPPKKSFRSLVQSNRTQALERSVSCFTRASFSTKAKKPDVSLKMFTPQFYNNSIFKDLKGAENSAIGIGSKSVKEL